MGCDSSHSDSVNNPWGNIQKPRTPRKLPPSHHFHLFQESPPHGTTSNNRITDQIVKNKEISESSFRGEFDRAKQHDYKFADVTFPDSSQALGEKYKNGVQWNCPKNFMQGEVSLFSEHYKLKLGKISNPYFVSALQMLATQPEVLKRILENSEVQSKGIYGIWLCVDTWKCFIVDDKIPTLENEPAFTSSGNNLVIPLIEKAYAKALGNYSRLETGLLGVFIRNLTGCPYEYFNKDSKEQLNVDDMWKFIVEEVGKGCIVAVSNQNNDRNENLFGKPEYSYEVITTSVIVAKGNKSVRLLKVANPWKMYDWTGAWSRKSKLWTPDLKQKLGFVDDDKQFWISIQDSSQNFRQVCSCQYHKESIYTFCRLTFGDEVSGFKGVFLTLDTKNKGYLTISQKDHRVFDQKYQYGLVRLIVCEVDREEERLTRFVTDYLDSTQNLTIPLTLDPGTYYLVVQCDWLSDRSRELVISFYGQHGVNLLEDLDLPKSQDNFINEMILLHEKQTDKERVHRYAGDADISRTTGSIAGYVYYHYSNQSRVGRYLQETVSLKERKHIHIQGMETKDEFSVRMDPGEEIIIKLKVDPTGNGFYSYSTKILFYVIEGFSLERLKEICDKSPTKTKKREVDGKTIEVFVKTYSYSGGIAVLYQNKMDKYAYVEELSLDMDNLILQNVKPNQKGLVDIELEPHSEKLLSFVIQKPGHKISFRTSMTFYLNTPEFQF